MIEVVPIFTQKIKVKIIGILPIKQKIIIKNQEINQKIIIIKKIKIKERENNLGA